jgi:phosphatidate cytidylyltransferase
MSGHTDGIETPGPGSEGSVPPEQKRPAVSPALLDFLVRLVTAIALGVVEIAAILYGGLLGWGLVVAIIAVMCVTEFFQMTRVEHRKPNEVFGVLAVALMPIAAALYALRGDSSHGPVAQAQLGAIGLAGILAILVVAALVWHLVFRSVTVSDTAITVFGAVYAGFTLSHLVLIRALDSGAELVLATIISIWANDVFAYAVGGTLGRHKLAPALSPKKSWEGFIAGTIGTMVVWGGMKYIIDTPLPWWWLVLTGLTISVAAVLGDLAESRIKREAGVKDSGRFLPGHGGFLDRFDSTIMVSVVAFYMLVFGLLFVVPS